MKTIHKLAIALSFLLILPFCSYSQNDPKQEKKKATSATEKKNAQENSNKATTPKAEPSAADLKYMVAPDKNNNGAAKTQEIKKTTKK